MAGSSRSCFSSIRATGSAHVLIVSAADRYARILKTFSPLISSRSAISEKTCAMGRLSTRQTVTLDGEIEQAGTTSGQRFGDRAAFVRWAVAEQTSAATGPAHFRRGRASGHGARNQRIDGGSCDTRRQTLPVLPLFGDGGANAIPIASLKTLAHRRGGIANAFEAVEDVPVAVD